MFFNMDVFIFVVEFLQILFFYQFLETFIFPMELVFKIICINLLSQKSVSYTKNIKIILPRNIEYFPNTKA